MHHVLVEQWSRGRSWLHRRDARAKLASLAVVLIAIGTIRIGAHVALAAYFALLLAATVAARLPVTSILLRAGTVLPFSGTFAVVSWLSGDPQRAIALVEKSYLSALAALILISTTPLPKLFAGLESLGVPRLINLVVQFLYRYLFVISEQAQHMRLASRCRGGGHGGFRAANQNRFQAAAGALAVLFARSYGRAEGVHRAMLARGFAGHFPLLAPARLSLADGGFFLSALAAAVLVRFVL
ncbi:MAG: energy-coupling factor transporter transmembrane component T [Bryobacteraceae bacterium]